MFNFHMGTFCYVCTTHAHVLTQISIYTETQLREQSMKKETS